MIALVFQIVGLCLDLAGVAMMANGFFVFRWRDAPAVLARALVDRQTSTGAGLLKRADDPALAFRGLAFLAAGFALQMVGLLITLFTAR